MTARKCLKKILPLALTVICLLAISVPAMAEEIDPDRTGSVSVSIRAYATDDVVGGGSLHLYQIAETTVTATEGAVYHYTDPFSGCSEDLLTADELSKAETAETFSAWVTEHDVAADMTVTVSADGKAYFADLSCGLYMITQAEAAEGYNAINAFLVSVPLNEDGTWIYDVDATPKTSPVTTTDEPKNEPKDEPKSEPKDEPDNQNPDDGNTGGTGTTSGGNTGGTGTSSGSGTSSSGNAKTGDINYYVYGVLVIGAAVVIVVVLRRRSRSAQ